MSKLQASSHFRRPGTHTTTVTLLVSHPTQDLGMPEPEELVRARAQLLSEDTVAELR